MLKQAKLSRCNQKNSCLIRIKESVSKAVFAPYRLCIAQKEYFILRVLTAVLIPGKIRTVYTVIYSYSMDSLGMLALNPDGSNMEGVVTEPVGLRYKGDGRYDFYYDC